MNEESAERAVKKIKSLMREAGVNELTIERQYLLEIFNHDLLELSSDDGLPMLKLSALKYFISRGIITKCKNKVVKIVSLFSNTLEVKIMMIVSTEGLPIASTLPQGVDETRIAAMAAALLSLSERAIIEMGNGDFDQLYIKGSNGYLLVMQAGPNAVIIESYKDP